MKHRCDWVVAAGLILVGLGFVRVAGAEDAPPPLEPPKNETTTSPFAPHSEPTPPSQVGPPDSEPVESVGPPPGPGAFYVAGAYMPEGNRVVWRPGYWAQARPGWEWIPSRWVRVSEGWSFRPGKWVRALDDRAVDPAMAEAPAAAVNHRALPRSGRIGRVDRYVVSRPRAIPDGSSALDSPRAERNGDEPAAPDLNPIPEPPAPGPEAPVEGEDRANSREGSPLIGAPPVLVPSSPYASARVPIPYWDGATLVVPPTRFSAGVVVPTAPRVAGNRLVYPPVGVLPPMPGRGDGPPTRRSRGGLLPGPVRGLLNQVLP